MKCNSKYKRTWINQVIFLEMYVVINEELFYQILVVIS